MLQLIYPKVKESKKKQLQSIVDELNAHIDFYQLDTPLRRTHFFAQIMQETGQSLSIEESFIYSVDGLKDTFKAFKNSPNLALKYGYTGRDPISRRRIKSDGKEIALSDYISIANNAYGERLGNGSIESGEGWKFRGRGLKQLTGKNNYIDFTHWHINNSGNWPEDTNRDFVSHPDLLLEIKFAVRSAAYFWVQNKLYEMAEQGTTEEISRSITKVVNEHTKSYELRFTNLVRLLKLGILDDKHI
jgi:predicted chitinase